MADSDEQILSYIIKGQDQTRAILEQHASLLEKIAQAAETMAASVDKAGKKTEESAQKISGIQKFMNDFVGSTNNASNAASNFSNIATTAFQNPTALITQLGSSIGSLVTGPMALLIGAAAAAATGIGLLGKELIDVTKEAIDMGASFDDMARKTQASVAGLSSLDFAAKAVGTSTASMVNAIFTLQQRIESNPANIQRGLEELNKSTSGVKITFDQLNDALRTDGVSAMLLLSDAFSTVSKNVDTASAVGDIFTKRFGKEILPALTRDLRGLSDEAKTLGYTFSAQDAAAAKEAEIEFNKLQLRFEALATTLGRNLIPVADLAAKEINAFFDMVSSRDFNVPFLTDTIEALKTIAALLQGMPKNLEIPSAPKSPFAPPTHAGPDIAGTDNENLGAQAAAAARLKTIMDDLHATFETHKRDQTEAAAIAKESITAQLAGQVALINQTETGFRAQLDIAKRTHEAHLAIIQSEFIDATKMAADLVAENSKYSAQRVEIENKANKALEQINISSQHEIDKVHLDANESWLQKRLEVIEADLTAQKASYREQFGDVQQYLKAVANAEEVARAKREGANSQYEKKYQQEVTRIADDIEIARVAIMQDGLQKQLALIDARIDKEKEIKVVGLEVTEAIAISEELEEKRRVEREAARVIHARKIATELFNIESDTQSRINELNDAGSTLDIKNIELQRDARIRYIQEYQEGNQQLIDAANKNFNAQVDIIRRLGVINAKQFADLLKDAKSKYEQIRDSGVASATDITQAWSDYWDLQNNKILGWTNLMQRSFSDIASAFGQLSSAGGGLGDFAKAGAAIAGGAALATDASARLKKGLDELGGGAAKDADGLAKIGTAAIQMAAALNQATTQGTKSLNVIGGIIAGAESGAAYAAVTGGWSVVAGAIIGGIVGAMRDTSNSDEIKHVMSDIGQEWGRRIGEGLGKEIAGFMDEFHVSEKVAAALDITKVLKEQGGFGAVATPQVPGGAGQQAAVTGLSKALESMSLLLVEVQKNGADASIALDGLNNTFGEMVKFMNTEMDGLVNSQMVEFILKVKESGEHVQAVTQFLSQMASQAEKGINAVVGGFAGSLNTAFGGIEGATDKINELADKAEKLTAEMAKEDPHSEKWRDLNRQLEAVHKEYEKLMPDVERWRKQLESAAGNMDGVTARADRMGRLLGTTFSVAIASGQSFVSALQAIAPGLQNLSKLQEEFGFKTSDTLQHLLDLSSWATNNKELADSLDGLNQLMKGLANSGAVTQQTFTDLGDEAVAQFNDIQAAGLSQDDALKAMQPSLQTLYELQKRFGYQVDESTQQLLDEAEASGTVGDAHQSAAERTVDAMEKVADILKLIAKHWGIDIPEAADKTAKATETAAATAAAQTQYAAMQTEILQKKVDAAGRAYDAMGDKAEDATDRANRGTKKVIYGESPGGIDDLMKHLDEAIVHFHNVGAAAAVAMATASTHTKEYINLITQLAHQLSLDTMSAGLERDLAQVQFQFEERMQQVREQFKDEPGGANQAILLLQQDLLAQQKAIQARYDKQATDAAVAAAKARNDQVFSLQQQLVQSQLDLQADSIEKTTALLNLQRDSELKSLREKFGDQVDFFNSQAAIVNEIYANKIAKAIADANDTVLESAKQLQDDFVKSFESLENELQDTVIGAMQDGTDKQLLQLQVQKERRLKALADQFGAESDMYKQQAAIIDQIYGIQASEIAAAGPNASLATLQKAYYAVLNSPVPVGQENQRAADLARLSERLQAAQNNYLNTVSNNVPAGLIPSNLSTASDLLQSGIAGGTVAIEIILKDASGQQIDTLNIASIEEAIAQGRITLVARNSSERTG